MDQKDCRFNLRALVSEMLFYNPKDRPNCQQILERLDTWSPDSKRFNQKELMKFMTDYRTGFANVEQNISINENNRIQELFQNIDSDISETFKLIPNEEFDEFNLIGQGSYGMVYKVRDKSDNSYYAIKILLNQGKLCPSISKALY